MNVRRADVLIVGSGVAGLSVALKVADRLSVLLVTKKHRAESNTNYAQGGIAAVMGLDDSPDDHIRDTLAAGDGLCHRSAVEALVREGPARVRELMEWGVEFTRSDGRLHLGREGGHSHRRIVHALDRTGRAIEHALLEAVGDHPNVSVLEDHLAVDLLVSPDAAGYRRCGGALVLDRIGGGPELFLAPATVLATGGFGRVYRHTTNPAIATGDGVAMAERAGARVGNLEFVQFHPTALYPTEDRAVLISEAVRGEGAVLRRLDGSPLMAAHPGGSLATRDVVARSIDRELKTSGAAHVWLDLSPIPTGTIEARFPNILADCAERGIDIRSDPVPVVPAAHYACGGVAADEAGCSSLEGLYAVGEVAFTGVHGANRLASNSLLEAVVYAHRAAGRILAEAGRRPASSRPGAEPPPPEPPRTAADGCGDSLPDVETEARDLMWTNSGIVRSDARLALAGRSLAKLEKRLADAWRGSAVGAELVELRNLVHTARLVVRCAAWRRESRGLHYNEDHPTRDDERYGRDTLLEPSIR